jgi:hypothetical protein
MWRTAPTFRRCLEHKVLWFWNCKKERRGRDSNPRYTCVHTGFRDRPDRPLRHLSERLYHLIVNILRHILN